MIFDRLISGAGALTDGADRFVRMLIGDRRGGYANTRPGSLVVAAILVIVAAMLVLAGLEATDAPVPIVLAPATVAAARDLGDRTYSTMVGSVAPTFVETYQDDNGNGVEDKGENTVAWEYFLVDSASRSGVTVRSTRPPETVLTFRASGLLVAGVHYTRESYPPYEEDATRARLQIDAVVLDATAGLGGPRTKVDLSGPLPPSGAPVEVSGAWLGTWIAACRHDPDLNGICDPGEEDQYETLVFDRVSRHAIRVLLREPPEFGELATMTGSLRRAERAVDGAKGADGLDFASLGLVVSDRYILEDGSGPGSAPLAFGVGAGLFGVAFVILVGLAGGYLIYRRSDAALPVGAMTLGAGERIPVRITGLLRTPTGLEHVREVPGELLRLALRPSLEAPDASIPEEPAAPPEPASVAMNLVVERSGRSQGVALGLGEVRRLSAGRVLTLHAPRPAVRVVAGTGSLVMSFDTEAERDRAAAQLREETGLGPDGRPIQTT